MFRGIQQFFKRAESAFWSAYRWYLTLFNREGIVGKMFLFLLPAFVSIWITSTLFITASSLIETLLVISFLAVTFMLGWTIGKLTNRFPALDVTVAYGLLFVMLIIKASEVSAIISEEVLSIIIIILSGMIANTIITYLTAKQPKSPFLSKRIYDSIPEIWKPLFESVIVFTVTIGLATLIIRGDELFKFAFNWLETNSVSDIAILTKRASDIDLLIDRKRNAELSYEDRKIITDTYFNLFEEQNKELNDLDRILSLQQSIPFLPDPFGRYLETKQRWYDSFTEWHTHFLAIKRIEYMVETMSDNLNDAFVLLLESRAATYDEFEVTVSTASAKMHTVRNTLDTMRENGMLTEPFEDYFAIHAKRIDDIGTLLLKYYLIEPIPPEAYSAMQEISNRTSDLDYEAIYQQWSTTVLRQKREIKNSAYTAMSEALSTMLMFASDPRLRDGITPIADRFSLRPKPDLSGMNKNPLPFLESEKESFRKQATSPEARFIRTALDAYVAGKNTDSYVYPEVRKQFEDDEFIFGMDAFSPDYYRGKFFVVSVDGSDPETKMVFIVFPDKPDRMFGIWIQRDEKDRYIISAFGTKKYGTEQTIKQIIEYYKEFMDDPNYTL